MGPMPCVFNGQLAVSLGTCLRCGLPGPHPRWRDCIAGLRDLLADQTVKPPRAPKQRRIQLVKP